MRPAASTVVDLTTLARYVLSSDCRSIAALTGAGVSVASGIPDFRSAGGMYDALRPELLTATPQERRLMERDPTYVVSWDIFRNNPLPYLEVRRPFILGTQRRKWKATIAHRFFELLHAKLPEKLTRVYTQNIDGLHERCCPRLPNDKIVNVHGTISRVECEGCGHPQDFDDFCSQVERQIKDIYHLDDSAPKESTPILCPNCRQPLVKPATVLFGRNLPEDFFVKSERDAGGVDLLFVAGTSLAVGPANSLVYRVPDDAVRVVVNRDPVGRELGIAYDDDGSGRDFFAQGECDEVFLELIRELGWWDDFLASTMVDELPPQSAELVERKRRQGNKRT